MIAYLYWDPNPYISSFMLPLLNRPILWYGLLFALGFFIGFWIFRYLLLGYLLKHPKFTKEDISSFLILGEKIKQEGDPLVILNHWPDIPKMSSSFKKGGWFFLSSIEVERLNKRVYLEQLFAPCLMRLKDKVKQISEKVSFILMIAAVSGARFFDVLFYQNIQEYIQRPIGIIEVWKGGLSSHGGAIGILIGVWFLSKKKIFQSVHLTYLRILDLIVIPTALAGCFIRIGNFINQEILGTPTEMPWGVIFGHPADGSFSIPRHPVQLYEAVLYLILFFILLFFSRKLIDLKKPGKLFGLFLIGCFCSRFFLEFFKVEQSEYTPLFFTMGQYLSIPFILLGCFLLYRGSDRRL